MANVTLILSLILVYSHLIQCQNSRTCSDVSYISDIDRDRLKETAASFKSTFQLFQNVPIDMVFVLESSGSIGVAYFDCEVQFVKQFTTLFGLSFNNTRVSVVVYSSCDKIHTYIDYIGEPNAKNKCTFKDDINSVIYDPGGTCTGGGLREAARILKTSPRIPAQRIVIVLTEGYTTEGESPIAVANDIRRMAGKVFVIGLGGGVVKHELRGMAGNSDNRLFLLEFTSDIAVLGDAIKETDLKDQSSWDRNVQLNSCDDLCSDGHNCCDVNALCACAPQSGSVDCACPPGFEGLGYRESCSECPKGTFKPQYGNQKCAQCPSHSTTASTGSTGIRQCRCEKGYIGDLHNDVQCSPVLCERLSGLLTPGVEMIPYNCGEIFATVCQFVCRASHRRIGGQETVKCLETGQWSGSPLKCRNKRRKTACEALSNPPNGQWSCNENHLEIGSSCVIVCDSGYEIIGKADKQCILGNDVHGIWTGETDTCKPILCPQLMSKPNMKLKPAICEGSTLPYGTICRYSCKRTYRLQGIAITSCSSDGTWTDKTFASKCVDNKPPTMTCPDNIVQTADPLKDSTEVSWNPPSDVDDNSGTAPMITSSHTPISSFFVGQSEVTYEATDAAGLKASCSFTITIIDNESPRVLYCPPDLEIQSYRTTEVVTWGKPIFIDNSGDVVEVVESHDNETEFAVNNSAQLVWYRAVDAAGNHADCNFTVAVKEYHCPYDEPPLNGKLTCERRLHNRFCGVSCNENYEFTRDQEVSYFCATVENTHEMEWQLPPYASHEFSFPWPDCSIKYDRKTQQQMSLGYQAYGCGNKDIFSEIERNFIQKFNDINEFCADGCSVDDFHIECRPAVGSVVGRKRRQSKNVVVNVVVITFKASFDTSRKNAQSPISNRPVTTINSIDILTQVVSNMQAALRAGNLTISVGIDLLRPHTNSFIVTDDIELPCGVGEIHRNDACVICSPGTFYNRVKSECTFCGRGKYQPDYGQPDCLQCPLGTTTTANNVKAKSLSDCKGYCRPGTYSSTGLQTCNVCPVGFYQPLTGRTYCHACQSGLTTWTEGSFSLVHCAGPCPRGRYSETGLMPCKPCPRGTFQTEIGQTSCPACPEGQYTHNQGVSTPRFCQVVNECDDFAPCQNGGLCVDHPRGYECQCMPGYFGEHCEIEIDECVDQPCKNNGVCVDVINGYQCLCPTGFEGINCQINTDDCVFAQCDNGAECVDGINEYTCACAPGFTGELCHINLFDCASSPCLNDGKCVDRASNYTCCCLPGYSGRHCEHAENSCISSPCMHNSTCTSRSNTFLCTCAPGYSGRRCAVEINECTMEEVTCHNGGTCHDLIGKYKCTCSPRYGGPYCETELANDFDLVFLTARTTNYAFVQTLPDLYAFTLAFWMRTSDQSNLGTPVSYGNFRNDGTFVDNALTLHNYNSFVLFINGESVHTNVKANDYSSWIHIAVTWQGVDGGWDVYVNGFLYTSGNDLQAGSFIRGGGSLIVGQEQDSFAGTFVRSEAFIGELSQLNIWDYRMTATEVKRKFETCLSDDNSGNALSWFDLPYRLRGEVAIQGPSNICQRIDDCHSLPCLNDGTCEDLFRSYICKCQSGYHGDRCEHISQNCNENACHNGGSCHDNGDGLFCSCLPEFTGTYCTAPVNLCYGVYCINGGTCRPTASGYTCRCRPGYAGRYCEYDVDECLVDNGGCDHTCHNTQGSLYCTCYGGYTLQPDKYTCSAKAFCLHHGNFHLRGETWNDGECSTCTCRNGQPVCSPQQRSCPTVTCSQGEEPFLSPGACCNICVAVSKTCSVSKRFGFDTFDGLRYEELGTCRYVLSEDYVSSTFRIEIEFEDEYFANVKRRMLFAHAGCVDVTIDFEGNVQVAGIDVELPYTHGNPKSVEIWRNTTFSERDVYLKTDLGIRLHWTMLDDVTLYVPKTLSNDLSGLCGNMNGKRGDDMLTRQFLPGRSEKEFMHSWKVDGYRHCTSLENVEGTALATSQPDTGLLFEQLSPQNLPACQTVSQAFLQDARHKCNTLRSSEFLKCHSAVSILLYYELCLQDVCSCRSNEPCYCQSLTAYQRECQRNEINVVWNDPACNIQCPVGMLYDHCGPACLHTCTSRTENEWCRQQPCRPRCQCPAGSVLHDGNCILQTACPTN